MKTEIIEKLKKSIKWHKDNATWYSNDLSKKEITIYADEAEKILQALEEQPFCDSCETIAKFVGTTSGICKEEKSILYNCQVDKTTSCVHHSKRKEKK